MEDRDFRNHLHSCMEFLNFKASLADPDVWMRPAIKSDGNTYYEYILLYVDNALVMSENEESILRNELGRYFHLKEESIGSPTVYLGGRVCKVQLEKGVWAWSFCSSQYVQSAVKNVEEYVRRPENTHLKIPSKVETPLMTNRNMSKSKGWTLQSSLLTLWMEKTRVNNQTKIDDNVNLLKTL